MLCSGILLCGGRGTRVGGVDKGWLEVEGRPLVEHGLERLSPQVNDLVISANRHLERYASLGYPVFSDTLDGYQGPLAGILSCLPQCAHEHVIVVPCDMPVLPEQLTSRLLAGLGARDVSYAWDGNRDQYLVAAWRRELAPALADYLASGGRAVHQWYAGLDVERVDFSDCGDRFANLNQLPIERTRG
jgi:molybdopterin-guanine dinucleotide biosynthesis protein A